MKTKQNKTNPRRILGYLMAFVMVFFSFGTLNAQCAGTEITIVNDGADGYASENSWSITNSSGGVVESGSGAGSWTVCLVLDDCYTFTMTDDYGDGQDGYWGTGVDGSFSATLANGTVVASGSGNWGSSVSGEFGSCGCTDPNACNYNASTGCTYPATGLDCAGLCLNGGTSIVYTAGGYPGEN